MNFFIILFLNIDNTHNFDRIIWCHHPVDQCCNAYAASSLFRAQSLFSRFDADKSGYISFSEFAVAGPSSHDVEEEAAVLQPQWDALSQVRFVHVALSQPDSNVGSSSLQALSSLRGLHGSEAPISSESAQYGEGSADADTASSRRRLSRRSQ